VELAPDLETAFARTIEPHLGRLLLLARRRGAGVLGADCDAEDLLQTALVTAWRLFAEFEDRGPEATFGWLAALLEGSVADRVKYHAAKGRGAVRHLESAQGAPPPVSVGTSITRLAARREARGRLDAALLELEPGQREVVSRHVIEGQSLAEIARALGVTKNAVFERLHRGLKRLRAALPGDA
jgi:RNA polymerase sigma factor (sigma-70 family)